MRIWSVSLRRDWRSSRTGPLETSSSGSKPSPVSKQSVFPPLTCSSRPLSASSDPYPSKKGHSRSPSLQSNSSTFKCSIRSFWSSRGCCWWGLMGSFLHIRIKKKLGFCGKLVNRLLRPVSLMSCCWWGGVGNWLCLIAIRDCYNK
jgi:hypothetical protein